MTSVSVNTKIVTELELVEIGKAEVTSSWMYQLHKEYSLQKDVDANKFCCRFGFPYETKLNMEFKIRITNREYDKLQVVCNINSTLNRGMYPITMDCTPQLFERRVEGRSGYIEDKYGSILIDWSEIVTARFKTWIDSEYTDEWGNVEIKI